MRIVVWVPEYSSSAGVRVCHYLCHCLNLIGHNAFITTRVVRPGWNTPFSNFVDDNTLVIYPEIASSNPLHAKHYLIYMLNAPGVIEGDSIYADNVPTVGYNDIWIEDFKRASKFFKEIIMLGAIEKDIFYNANRNRFRKMLWIHKGAKLRERYKFKNEFEMFIIDYALPTKVMADMLRETIEFYTYDDKTALMLEAYLCGAKIIAMREDGEPYEWNPPEQYLQEMCMDIEKDKVKAQRIVDIALQGYPEWQI